MYLSYVRSSMEYCDVKRCIGEIINSKQALNICKNIYSLAVVVVEDPAGCYLVKDFKRKTDRDYFNWVADIEKQETRNHCHWHIISPESNEYGNRYTEYKGRMVEMNADSIFEPVCKVTTKAELELEDCIKHCKQVSMEKLQELACGKDAVAITMLTGHKNLYIAHSYCDMTNASYTKWKLAISDYSNDLLPNIFVIVEPVTNSYEPKLIFVDKRSQGLINGDKITGRYSTRGICSFENINKGE